MSKKRFTQGLESLFAELPEERSETTPSGSTAAARPEQSIEEVGDRPRRSSAKNFASELQGFLEDSFEKTTEVTPEKTVNKRALKKRRGSSSTGLDALIKSTIQSSRLESSERPTRRMTIAFDEEKLTKLKSAAKQERVFLKDLIDKMVSEFIEVYEDKKGKLDS